ncbi:putative uncharacterized protein DDB_G0282133 isoform X2 [Sitophilus oryzae]|uniref:Uncharacterized protein n=1 Tax=Sitophilus oryzae TaxID=7048 RepID=A0A6J2YQA3_SITOR|nr:putative uncharacterized protein DDB_G0282133 isoform X2 [Sitophilus oryzae]
MIQIYQLPVLILLLVVYLLVEGNDLLSQYRPNPEWPQELNNFLLDVQRHKNDFAFIRNVAAKRKNYEKQYAENKLLLNEDLEDDSLQRDYQKPTQYEQKKKHNKGLASLNRDTSFDFDEKYSKFIHSPIRLRRGLDVKVAHDSSLGEIKRPGRKIPNNENILIVDKNAKLSGLTDSENNEQKIKRDVEINIKSDGQLIKKIDEVESAPKSIILNIKSGGSGPASGSSENLSPIKPESQSLFLNHAIQPAVSTSPAQSNDFSYIPSVNSRSNLNQNINVPVPINPMPNSFDSSRKEQIDQSSFQKPEMAQDKTSVDRSNDLPMLNKQFNENSKSMERNFDSKSIVNNRMENVIDTALNSDHGFERTENKEPSFESNINAGKDDTEFDRVQGLVMENNNANNNNNVPENKLKNSPKKKRYEDISIDKNESLVNVELENLDSAINSLGIGHSENAVEQHEHTTAENADFHVNNIYPPEQKNEHHPHKERNDRFHIIEEATKDVYIIPVTECPVEDSGKEDADMAEEEKKEEMMMSHAIEKEEKEQPRHEAEKEEITLEENNDAENNENQEEEEDEEEYSKEVKKHKKTDHENEAILATEKRESSKNENSETRDKKHLPPVPKYKRKHIRQHQPRTKVPSEERLARSFYRDDGPEEAFDFIPSLNQRTLKSVNYDYDPNLLTGFDSNDQENIIRDTKELLDSLQSQDDYEDLTKNGEVRDKKAALKYKHVKKKEKKSKKRKHKNRKDREVPIPEYMFHYYDPFQVGYMKRKLSSLDYEYNPEVIDDSEINKHMSSDMNTAKDNAGIRKKMKSEDDYGDEEEAEPHEEKDKDKVNLHKTTEENDDQYNYSEIEPLNDHDKSSLKKLHRSKKNHNKVGAHRGQSAGSKKIKMKKKKKPGKPQGSVKGYALPNKHLRKPHHHLNDRPLTAEEKQDIFLRYNPEFQRWPRFVQNNPYKGKQVMENDQILRNSYNRFPISNEYYLSPKREEFVKRENEASAPGAMTTMKQEQEQTIAKELTTSAIVEQSDANPPKAAAESQKPDQSVNANGIETGTLPPAAKDILETAESDLFENTTVPEFSDMNAQNGNNSIAALTPLVFTTNAEDLTEDNECVSHVQPTVCPDDNVSHVPVTMTTILSIASEDMALLRSNASKEDYLDLNEILQGSLPREIVSQSFSNAKGNLRKGLNTKKYNTNLRLSSYNSGAETKMILNEMSNLMTKLRYHTSCQQLPPDLKSYLKVITGNNMESTMDKIKEMEDVDFDDHQSTYVFHTGDTDTVQSKAATLKELLVKFDNLPADCRERAEPVKEYIESHLAMIDNMNGKSVSSVAPKPKNSHRKTKKDVEQKTPEDNLEEKVVEEGLNNPNANANEIIEDLKKEKRDTYGDAEIYNNDVPRTTTSQQYGRLAEAVRKIRYRRENERRISQMFGSTKRKRSPEGEEELTKDNKGFESPLVIHY